MPFRPCVSGCGRYLAPGDGYDRCLSCLGIEHAEAAFVDESCPHCGGMTVAGLRTRLRFLQRGGVPVPLPRSRSAVPDSDPEMVAMLARAAESVGFEWRPPPCPEPSRLDDWFLGVARAGSQGPTPVPFFPDVHDELTGTWTAPFTARNRSSGSSSLATLDGGAARGYTEVPTVERSVAMQLCPRTASTWRGNPLLPSRACRHSSALTGSAYAACIEAASALHAMALLQVQQAKARPRSSQ